LTETRELPEDALLIWDGRKLVAVMSDGRPQFGGFLLHENIFLGAYILAVFGQEDFEKAGLTSGRRTGSRGDTSNFERRWTGRAHDQEVCGGTIFEIIDAYPVKTCPNPSRWSTRR
jgi:hypothetical protein